MVIMILYLLVGWWAVGETIYANKIRFGTLHNLWVQRLALALVLGWILIPIAIIKKIFLG